MSKKIEIDLWPAENPETGYLNVDSSPTKTEMIQSRRNKETDHFWQNSFGNRQAEELYNIKSDSECFFNLIDDDKFKRIVSELKHELLEHFKKQKDPRILGNNSIFGLYPYKGNERNLWNRMKSGEKVNLCPVKKRYGTECF